MKRQNTTHVRRSALLAAALPALLLAAAALGACAEDPVPVSVVVVGPSAGGEAEAAARERAFSTVAEEAWRQGAILVLAVLEPDGRLRTVFSETCVVEAPNDVFAELGQQTRTAAMLEQFRAAQAGSGGEPGGRLLGALRELQAEVRGLGDGTCRVLVMDAGLLREPLDVDGPGVLADPRATAARLFEAGYLPDLAGWSLAFLTPGTGSDERKLALTALWWAILDEAGGQLCGFQSALVAWPLEALPEPPVPGVVEIARPDGLLLRLPGAILFDVDEARLRPAARPLLDELAARLMKEHPDARLEISGHTDATASAAYNLRLSRARAAAVARALETAGVPRSRLTVIGRGESEPVADNATAAGRQANRRVEIAVEE